MTSRASKMKAKAKKILFSLSTLRSILEITNV